MFKKTMSWIFVNPAKNVVKGTAGYTFYQSKTLFSMIKGQFRSVFPPISEVKRMTQDVRYGPPKTPFFWLKQSLSKTWPMFLFAVIGLYGACMANGPIARTIYLVGAIFPVTVGVLTSLYIYFSRKKTWDKAI